MSYGALPLGCLRNSVCAFQWWMEQVDFVGIGALCFLQVTHAMPGCRSLLVIVCIGVAGDSMFCSQNRLHSSLSLLSDRAVRLTDCEC